MNVTTKFNLADIVYGIDDASKGDLIPLTVIRIMIEVLSLDLIDISYEVRNNEKFSGSEYEEYQLLSYTDAKELATTQLEQDISTIQHEIDNL